MNPVVDFGPLLSLLPPTWALVLAAALTAVYAIRQRRAEGPTPAPAGEPKPPAPLIPVAAPPSKAPTLRRMLGGVDPSHAPVEHMLTLYREIQGEIRDKAVDLYEGLNQFVDAEPAAAPAK